jgi:hypothetical protein
MEAILMGKETKGDTPDASDRVREIPKWVKRYAHNRTLPTLANLGLFLLALVAIGGSSMLAAREGQAGHKVAAVALVVVSLAGCALWIWLVTTHRSTRLSGALSNRLYGTEGTAVAAAKPRGRSRTDMVVPIALGLCVALQILAGFVFETTIRYLVPIMAAYSVPFLLYIWARQGGRAAPFMLLWPGLLVIHAALALAGVPPFNNEPNAVNVLVPVFGYGAIAALVSHVYSRVALRRLRSLACGPEADKTGGGRHA